jgi:glutathione synthase/RimK-type ligase-like ATP-grasp enzyme
MARALGLELAGIDLRIGADGVAYCFEVNPSPAFSFFELHTGQPIAASIAQHLLAPRGERRSRPCPPISSSSSA